MVAGFKLYNISIDLWVIFIWTHIYDKIETLTVATSKIKPSESPENPTNALNLCHQHMALFCESGESGAGYYVIQDEDGSHSHGISMVWVSVFYPCVCVSCNSSSFRLGDSLRVQKGPSYPTVGRLKRLNYLQISSDAVQVNLDRTLKLFSLY